MIWTVSTVKDTPANLERFVERNLAGGADHVVVFVDDDDAEALDYLANHPHTTGVAALSWWGESRPAALNSRQRIAANAVRAIAADLGDVDWLFHPDGDETLQSIRPEFRHLASRCGPCVSTCWSRWPNGTRCRRTQTSSSGSSPRRSCGCWSPVD
ncbi:glycosyltransferase family 2 protein [Nocardioides sp. B-3]|uniref:glycosyltransferase family 2 protein n=1 Tax=Nocardioides sp. B-3 TaxID=2895565 RepID=UPI003FA5A6CF